MPYDVARPAEFGKIPDATWPSDHLALGVALQIVATQSPAAASEPVAMETEGEAGEAGEASAGPGT